MMKKIVAAILGVMLVLGAAAALAETGVAYGVYSMEGEQPDSLIRITLTVEEGKITDAQIDEKLLPASFGGAEGWATLADASVTDAVLEVGGKSFPAAFLLDGTVWTGEASEDSLSYTAELDGQKVDFMDYIVTDEGAAWYFDQTEAALLKADGSEAATVEIGTKESTGHGEAFWPSELKFSGNIAAIEAYLVANGVDYAQESFAQNDQQVWTVADAVTGATLAGTPNYLLIAQKAFENAQQ